LKINKFITEITQVNYNVNIAWVAKEINVI